MADNPQKNVTVSEGEKLKIYFLPNLLTAGNLFCGFVALTKIVEANLTPDASGHVDWMPIKFALAAILLACIFDLFDGRVASLTLFIIKLNEKEKDLGHWGYLLPVVLVFLSAMMVSEVRYPSFKSLGLRSSTTFLKLIVAVLFAGSLFVLREKILYYVLPLFFTGYLVYGFIRPHISRAWRKEIEEDDDESETAN